MTDFAILQQFVTESNSTNSNTDKLDVLKRYCQNSTIKTALVYTYSPFKQYHVTSATCKKRSDIIADDNAYNTLFDLLDDLHNRHITGHTAIAAVNRFVQDHSEYSDLIWSIIDRNLKTRSTATMINKIIPGLVPEFNVALAAPFDQKTEKLLTYPNNWYISRKLDGVRCICMVDAAGNVTTWSRQGKQFETLKVVEEHVRQLGLCSVVFDGEICMVDMDGNEDFQGIMKQIRRKDHTIQNPKYLIFDMLTLSEFESGTSSRILSQRLAVLQDLNLSGVLGYVEQIAVQNRDMLEIHASQADELGWEGLMVRKDTTYQGKRSNDILKVKSFHDAEYVVKHIETGTLRVIENGLEVEEEMLSNIIIEHKGCDVSVGSGFSLDQRRNFFKNPNQLIGSVVTIKYFEETQNQQNGYSLRFPTVKTFHGTFRNT